MKYKDRSCRRPRFIARIAKNERETDIFTIAPEDLCCHTIGIDNHILARKGIEAKITNMKDMKRPIHHNSPGQPCLER